MSLRNPSRSTLGLYLFLLVLGGAISGGAGSKEDAILDLLKANPSLRQEPVTLIPEEREEAIGWPITKIYLTTQRLVLNRTNP
jgi:hypothetical protein